MSGRAGSLGSREDRAAVRFVAMDSNGTLLFYSGLIAPQSGPFLSRDSRVATPRLPVVPLRAIPCVESLCDGSLLFSLMRGRGFGRSLRSPLGWAGDPGNPALMVSEVPGTRLRRFSILAPVPPFPSSIPPSIPR
jgi:hypothetical protein